MSRTSKSIKNISVSFVGQILTMALSVVTRTVFIKTLGSQYLGIGGLFSNIINMLSLAELGVGTAIIYNLYKPLAEDDIENICKYMNLYKITYRVIGLFILIIGLLCMPILPSIINGDTSFFNIYLVFLLYLFQSISTYLFFAYKSSLVKANQNDYIASGITYIVTLIFNIIKIVSLLIYANYYLYLVLTIAGNLVSNISISFAVDHKYPYLSKNKYGFPKKSDILDVFKNCGALSIYKVNNVILKSIDNIVISKYISLIVVGIYSNYTLIDGYIKQFLNILYNGILYSLGNLHVTQNDGREYQVFKTINFLTFWLFGVFAIGINTVINPLISLWLGDEFLLSSSFVLLFSLEFYLYGTLKALSTFRTSMGLFKQAAYRPFLGAVINVVMSVALVGPYGISGVIAATIIANLLTYFPFDSYIIYKYGLHRSVREYYLKQIKYIFIVAISGLFVKAITLALHGEFLRFLIGGILSVLIPSLIICAVFYRTEEFKDVKVRFIALLKKKVK